MTHYSTMKSKYGDTIRPLYTDTASLIYQVKTEDWYIGIPRVNNKLLGKKKHEHECKIYD